VNDSTLPGYTEAMSRRLHGFGRWCGPDHSREADLVLFLVIRTHSSRCDDASDPFSPYAGAGLGRSPSIRRKISWNNSLGTATSAIWKMT